MLEIRMKDVARVATHSTQGVCGPSFNGSVNDPPDRLPLISQNKLRLLQPTGASRNPRGRPHSAKAPSLASTSVVKAQGYPRRRSGGAQIVCRGFAGPAIGYNVEQNLLSLIEAAHPGTFDGTDVHENVLAAIIRLNKTEALLAVEPLYRTLRHITHLSGACLGRLHSRSPLDFEIWRRSSVQRGSRGRAKSFGRNSIVQR